MISRLKKVLDNKRKIIEKINKDAAQRQLEPEEKNWQEMENENILENEHHDEDVFF